MVTPKSECINALQEAADRLGESPSKAQYEDLGLTPSSATIIRQLDGWNAAKEAAGLRTNASRGSRVASIPDDVELPDELSWEELTVDQRWHYRNVEWNTERTLRRRAGLRRWINEQKRGLGCERCGCDTAGCLDFHHLEEDEKVMDIGTMVTYGFGCDALRNEMEKCEVLCANCHRREHYLAPSTKLREWVHGIKAARGACSECGVDEAACLDFHHVTEVKADTISRLVADGRSRDAIRKEMQRCVVLCANCHRRTHYEPPGEHQMDAPSPEHDNNK